MLNNSGGDSPVAHTDGNHNNSLVLPGQVAVQISLPDLAPGQGDKFWTAYQAISNTA